MATYTKTHEEEVIAGVYDDPIQMKTIENPGNSRLENIHPVFLSNSVIYFLNQWLVHQNLEQVNKYIP